MGSNLKTNRDICPGFANMIMIARDRLGWSRRDLAEAAGVAFNSIYAIENERRAPSLSVASRIVKALGIRVDLAEPGVELVKKPRKNLKPS